MDRRPDDTRKSVRRQTSPKARTIPQPLSTKCYEHGPVASTAGSFNNMLRILVPLVVTDAQFNKALAILEAALASVAERTQAALSRG